MKLSDCDRTIVFDLDGTLLDTAPDLIAAINYALRNSVGTPLDPGVIRSLISKGGREMIKFCLQSNGLDHSEHELHMIFEQFIEYYKKNLAINTKPFPGLIQELDRLSNFGCKLAVCTNKLESLARELLSAFGLSNYFHTITGRDTFSMCKPDPRHLLGTISSAGGRPLSTIMIGDSNTDVKTARAAGVPIVGVTFGYSDVPIEKLNCNAIISHYDQLPIALESVVNSK